MVEIRRATRSDNLQALWRLCFDGDLGEDFFPEVYRPENALVCGDQQEIFAMLHCLEVQICRENALLPGAYFLGVATHPRHRGRGYASELIRRGLREAECKGMYLACLIPGEAGLVDYYKDLGFTLRGHRPLCVPSAESGRIADENDINALETLYNTVPNRINRNKTDWKRIIAGYEVRLCETGYTVTEDGQILENYPFPQDPLTPRHPLAACIHPLGNQLRHPPYINLLFN